MCMLILLEKYAAEHGNRLGVVTVDHGFRSEARAEAEYVRDFCAGRGIPFYLREIRPGEVPPTEEAARIRRYELVSETAADEGYDKVALAHNADDRAETMLFNLFRGSGITGLRSITPIRDIYIRPILPLERSRIEALLTEEGIEWCTDSTNLADDYSRNRIRHHILPAAAQINSGVLRHMYETADMLGEIQDHIEQEVRRACEIVTGEGSRIFINIKAYESYDRVIRTGILRRAITNMTPHLKDITRDHILNIDALTNAENGASVDLPYGIRAYREYENLCITGSCHSEAPGSGDDHFSTRFVPILMDISDFSDTPTGVKEYIIPTTGDLPGGKISISLVRLAENVDKSDFIHTNKYTKCFDYDKINKLLTLRTPAEGDRITIDPAGHTKSLNRYLIDEKVPRRLRDSILLVCDGADAVWVTGYRDSCAYRIDNGTKRVLIIEFTEGNNG
ncbi:MAG: tRNA lysidine(34) synthetase TilS [Lachnospiraceae bacterium]|nr:tRNA lysidine(34) synthetase TilS [Lachnospiraceae bacterium]MBQ8948146.1 tRNA lysidine(34) synthetase TilS [Lachnospiraceae bacterium]